MNHEVMCSAASLHAASATIGAACPRSRRQLAQPKLSHSLAFLLLNIQLLTTRPQLSNSTQTKPTPIQAGGRSRSHVAAASLLIAEQSSIVALATIE